MKFRSDFVTNSSSSSFVIAKRDDCTRNDIQALLGEDMKQFRDFVGDNIHYMYLSDEVEALLGDLCYSELDSETKEIIINKLLEEAVEDFYNMDCDLKLDKWNISAREYGNECDSGVLGLLIYSLIGTADTEKIKIG